MSENPVIHKHIFISSEYWYQILTRRFQKRKAIRPSVGGITGFEISELNLCIKDLYVREGTYEVIPLIFLHITVYWRRFSWYYGFLFRDVTEIPTILQIVLKSLYFRPSNYQIPNTVISHAPPPVKYWNRMSEFGSWDSLRLEESKRERGSWLFLILY